MKVLIIGAGGREHALAWKIAQSPRLEKLFICPGNAGTSAVGTNLPIEVNDFQAIEKAIRDNEIDLLIVGPEQPLDEGIRDYFEHLDDLDDLLIIGPGKAGALLESSKDFAKSFMLRHKIPTAASKTFNLANLGEGGAYLASLRPPYVLKADGLAAGKGVIITESLDEAKQLLRDMIENSLFGLASAKVVVEEFLQGIELSVFVLTDGKDYIILPEAKDYKRIGEGDTGPNTGGMGSISPVIFANKSFMDKVETRIIRPTIEGLAEDNIPYIGFIFFGLMNIEGEPYVIEYNVRLGDPESQSLIPRIQSDLLDLLELAAKKMISEGEIRIDSRYCTSVILASGGYPDNYEKGLLITGLKEIEKALVFHAGTRLDEEGQVRTAGGRVLAVTALGNELKESISQAYDNTCLIQYEKRYLRRDIGRDLLDY